MRVCVPQVVSAGEKGHPWCGYVIGTAEKYRGQNKLPREIDRCLWNTGFHYGEWLIPSQSGNGFDKTAMT